MQTIGYFIDKRNNEKIKVLIRIGKKIDKFNYVINLKIRKSGDLGERITEEEYLNENPELIDNLKNNENIYC